MGGTVRGVDSEGINGSPVEASRTLASKTGTVVVMSGATDIITDGARTSFVENGHELMGKISGTGCMATSVVAAFAAASNDWVLSSTAALAAFGIAGERAAEREITPYAYKIALMDEVSALTHQRLAERARVRFV
jgi:hydroxyethylthiazole kinase